MWKISILSLLVCVLLMVSYLAGGVASDAHDTFKVVLGCYEFIFIVSTGLMICEIRKANEKVQTSLGEQ